MKRRQFITLAGGAAAWPVMAQAQQRRMPVIGYLSSFPIVESHSDAFIHAFRSGLSESGLVEGRQVTIEYRSPSDGFDQLPAHVADLVNGHVDLIVAVGGPSSAIAAMAATKSIPIIFVTGGDPIGNNFVTRINRPGGNVTGITFFAAELSAKRLEFLQEMIPGAKRIAVLNDPAFPEYLDPSKTPRIELVSIDARSRQDIDGAVEQFARSRVDGLFVGTGPLFNDAREMIVGLAARHRMPAIYLARESVETGGLMSYGANVPESFREAGVYAAKILKGDKPGDLPVLQPRTFDLVINLKTAKALGVTVPQTLLVAATEVIE